VSGTARARVGQRGPSWGTEHQWDLPPPQLHARVPSGHGHGEAGARLAAGHPSRGPRPSHRPAPPGTGRGNGTAPVPARRWDPAHPRSREHTGRAGAAQPGEEKALGTPQSSCQYLKGACRKDGDRLFSRACSDRTRVMALN